MAAANSEQKSPRRKPGRVPKSAVRDKYRECLNVAKIGYDCEIPTCPLYRWMPWQGRPMPSR